MDFILPSSLLSSSFGIPGLGGAGESADAARPRRRHHPLLPVGCGAAPRWAPVDPQDQGATRIVTYRWMKKAPLS